MSAGDYVVRRNASNTDTVPNAGSDLLLLWDTAVANVGSGITYSAGTFTLGETGRFLVLCSDQYGTTSTTNNERINLKTTFTLNGSELNIGYSTGFIRKNSGHQETLVFSAGIIEVTTTTGSGDELQIRTERIDNTVGVGEEPDRVADRSGITILKLDDSWNYGRYSSSAATATSATDNAATVMNLQTTVEEDSPFTRTTNTIDIATGNLVLAVYSLKSEDAAPSGRAEYQGRLTLAGSVVPGSYSHTYIRVTDNSDWGGMSNVCLLEPTSGDDLELEVVSRETGGEEFEAELQLIELPASAKAIIVEATTGDFNASATDFAWDTNPYIDTDTYTHTAGNANIDVDLADDYLVFASQATETFTAVTRAGPAIGFRVNTTDITYAGNECYHRNSGTAGFGALSTGTLLTGLSASDSIYTRNDRLGTASGAIATGVGAMSVISWDSLFNAGSGTTYTLTADGAALSLTGGDATLEVKQTVYTLQADGAVLNLTGGDATLTAAPAPAGVTYTLKAEGAELNLSSSPVGLSRNCAAADFSDDYDIIGAAADNFDCDATGGWTTNGGGAQAVATNGGSVEGTNSLELVANATGVAAWYQDVSSGDRFKITEKDLMFWFYYVKGKGSNYLTQTATAVVLRLYFGGTTDYADYQLTAEGDLELNFGWQVLQCSGTELNGGSTSGTWSNTPSNWDRDIHRVELRLDFATANSGGNEVPLRMDCFFAGTKIVVESGDAGTPVTLTDVQDYSETGRTAFPLGLVRVSDKFADLLCGLDVGTDTCQGYVKETERFILFNQASEEVKHNLVVYPNSTIEFGELEEGNDGVYPVRGCQVVLPPDRFSDIDVKDRGRLNAYNTKFLQWRYIYLGDSSDTDSVVNWVGTNVDGCETVYFQSENMILDTVEIYNNAQQINDHCAEMSVEPLSNENMLVHDCNEGVHFRGTLRLPEYTSQDNTNYDLAILEGETVTLVNSIFDEDKIKRVT